MRITVHRLQSGRLEGICIGCRTAGGVSLVSIIVAFPNRDNAAKIRNLIVRGGMDVTGVCTAGAQALQYADMADEGIVVCGYKLKDMMYTELREYLPGDFEMLLVASSDKWTGGAMEGVIFNLSDRERTVSVPLEELGVPGEAVPAEELWTGGRFSPADGALTAKLPAHGCALLQVHHNK